MTTNWKAYYAERSVSAAQAVSHVGSGQRVIMGHACGTPEVLAEALVARADELRGVEIVHMVSMGAGLYCKPEYADSFRHISLFAGGTSRQALAEGRADYIPCYFRHIPGLFASEDFPVDVAMVVTTRPDADGYVSLGVSVDYGMEAVRQAGLVIAEVTDSMPFTNGNSRVHVSEIDWFVETDRPILELQPVRIGDVERAIGSHIASLVHDGDCLQLGIGGIPDAVLGFLGDKKDLGVHSEMVSDGVMNLMEKGVITCRNMVNGRAMITFAMGTRAFYDWLHRNESVRFEPVDVVNDPALVARNDNLVSINSAISVDVMGQVAADMMGARQFSGVGGQVDFVQAARLSKGGRSIIALPSTASGGKVSRICATLQPGQAVTTSRNDVDMVVTEFGIARLRGKTIRERAVALIRIAHPDFKQQIRNEAEALYGFTLSEPD